MKKPKMIREQDISKIVVTDGKAYINIYKNNINDEYYIIDYQYNRKFLNDDERYCNICGAIYKLNSDHRHKCNEDSREIYRYDKIIDIIYNYIEDGMSVTIYLKDERKYKFKL